MIFGRCFEKALSAYYCGEDSAAVLFKEWEAYRDEHLDFGKGGSWDKILHQGTNLLHKFAQEDCIRIFNPKNLQLKLDHFRTVVSFSPISDAVGEIDGQRFLIDWKTTTSRYAEEPDGLLALDPQLICYSWISGIREVALVVFVRKHLPEIQYLTASISESQQKEFGELVESAVGRIEAGQFPRHTGIRFPMNGCTSCAHLGLCLGNEALTDTQLVRRPGASDLDWLDQLAD